jgi:hypothetical protein
MSKLGFVFALVVLVLAPVMPMAASPHRGSPTGTPTPSISDHTDGVPVEGTDSGSIPMAMADGGLGHPVSGFNPQGSEGGPDPETIGGVSRELLTRLFKAQGFDALPEPEAMEDFRGELLKLVDVLDEIYDEVYPTIQSSGKEPAVSPKELRQLIQELTVDDLYVARASFVNYGTVKNNIEVLGSLALTSGKGASREDKELGPSLDSFTVIPTPTPVGQGIRHFIPKPLPTPVGKSIPQTNTNIDAGDIFVKEGGSQTPNYPVSAFPCFTNTRAPNPVVLGFQITVDALKVVQIVAKNLSEMTVVICPAPGQPQGQAIPGAAAVEFLADMAGLLLGLVLDAFNMCIGAIDGAEILASFENTQILHADLDEHDKYLKARADTIDQFLFDFRNLNLRLNIEANLVSPEDNPNSLFALPSSICIKDDPQPGGFNVEVVGDPNDPLTPERLRRCGLLEVVSDTVRSAIDMTSLAGQDVNNAEAEFQAAVEHFDAGEWKLSYARFRKAYREAVRP